MTEAEKDFMEVHSLIMAWRGKESQRVPSEDITRIFNIYNKVTGSREYSKSCGGCRQRVWSRLGAWYDSNKQNYEHLT
jgi:hypothetical protein